MQWEVLTINIENNLLSLKEKINEAKKCSGNQDVKLIAVTKTVDVATIEEAIECGVTDIGENRVQELTKKYDEIGDKVNYHMIGHLQSNKVKYIIDKVVLIHSLDRMSLAKEINKRAKNNDIIMDTLVQVNVSEEESKFGLSVNQVHDFLKKIEKYENINVKGLMTIAPHEEDIEKTRWVFRDLKKLAKEIEAKNYKQTCMDILSMGMTNDYVVAIEEGSNMIRVGTGIFGKRNY